MVAELESYFADTFVLYKTSFFAVSFLLACFIQLLRPHQNNPKLTLKNWQTNLPMALLNTFLVATLCGNCVCRTSINHLGLFDIIGIPYAAKLVLSFLLLDLVAYGSHRIYHYFDFLWRFHSVHHSDTIYETSTALRFHPVEIIFSLGLRIAIVWVVGIPVGALLFFEAVYILFNLLEHSDFNLPEGADRTLSKIFVTPSFHRLHHSTQAEELNSNFGTVFSLWDRFFGTYRLSSPTQKIWVGLGHTRNKNFLRTLLLPFERTA